ncbi:MAG: hypothetical protein MUC43_13525, partial [Pirellula sp.]|nr:hypothetical protein [Pirellula sp.]
QCFLDFGKDFFTHWHFNDSSNLSFGDFTRTKRDQSQPDRRQRVTIDHLASTDICPPHDRTVAPLIAVFRAISYGIFPRNAHLMQLNNVFVPYWLAQAV